MGATPSLARIHQQVGGRGVASAPLWLPVTSINASRKGAPSDVADALASVFVEFGTVTSGVPPGCIRQGIDHIAIDDRLQRASVRGWPNDQGGTRTSDHYGVVADVHLAR